MANANSLVTLQPGEHRNSYVIGETLLTRVEELQSALGANDIDLALSLLNRVQAISNDLAISLHPALRRSVA